MLIAIVYNINFDDYFGYSIEISSDSFVFTFHSATKIE